MNATAFTLLLAAALPVAAHAATPCDAPEQYVRSAKLDVRGGSPDAAPLLRPYVIGGIAALAVREEGGRRWLELAAHSAEDARRQLLARTGGGGGGAPAPPTRRGRGWPRRPDARSAGIWNAAGGTAPVDAGVILAPIGIVHSISNRFGTPPGR